MTRRPILGVLAVSSLASFAHAQVSFTPIPDLPGGTNLNRARAVSGDGHVVVGMSNSANGDEAMRWVVAAPGAGGLGDLPGGLFSSDAFACNFDGSVVFGAGTNASGNNEAYRWTAAGGMVSLGFLPTGGYVSRAYGSSFDGAIACGENLFQPTGAPPPLPITQAFRWTQSGGMQGLGFLQGTNFYSTARAMTSDGSMVVGWGNGADFANYPFVWTQATGMQQIGTFPGTARGIAAYGGWVVGGDSSTSQAFRWNQFTGSVEEIGILPGRTSAIAVAISADGSRVLAVCNGGPGQVAAIWDQGIRGYSHCGPSWTSVADHLAANGVSTTGWSLTVALGMDPTGTRIVGYGINPSGQTQAWTATLYTPPSSQCGTADYNCDGDVGTDADIESFFACLAGSCPPPPCCSDADYNGDGDVGTDADIEAFFRVLAGSC
jgi:probable HAF family extracellular repeat protein